MKFLCLACDEPMTYTATDGPDEEGALSITFRCSHCGHELALLTNPMETQFVRSLNIKIGGRTVPAQPYELMLETLPGSKERILGNDPGASDGEVIPSPDGAGKCPFSAMLEQNEDAPLQEPPAEASRTPRWMDAAAEALEEIPKAHRPMIMKAAESYVLERGQEKVTGELFREAREKLGF